MIRVSTILFCILAFVGSFSLAQGQTKKVYQLSGLVVSKDTQDPIPYVRIGINHSRRGAVSNLDGFYSIPVVEGDTLYFSSLGYQTGTLVFSDYLEEYQGNSESEYVYVINYLEESDIMIPMVRIFPYNTRSELHTAIVNTDVGEAIESINARQNLDPKSMDVLIDRLDVDEGERVLVARQMYYNQHQQKNVAPMMPLFDPVAVYQLLKYINDKSKEKKNQSLDYWNE